MASSSRLNPKDKYRNEEDKMDEVLKAAGLYEEGMTFEMKKSFLNVLDESRTDAQNQSFQEVLNADTQEHALSQGSGSPAAKVARIATDEKENDEKQSMKSDTEQDTTKPSSPADMFDFMESNDVEVIDCTPNQFQETNDEPVSENEEEANTSTSDLVVNSNTENVVVKDRINCESERVSKQVIQAEFLENEDSLESFKSTKDVIASNSPVYEPETTKIHLSKFRMPAYNYLRSQEYKSILRANITVFKTQDEPPSFYEINLAGRPKMKHRRCPFYFDGSIDRNKQRNVIKTELKTNSILLQQLHYEQNYPDYPKWADPIRTCSSSEEIQSMDKYTSGEPKECTTLPWGQKPIVLDWKKGKQEASKKFPASSSSSSNLSLSRTQKMLQAAGVTLTYSEASTSRNFDPERRSVRPVKTTYTIDSSDEDVTENKSDDLDWLESSSKNKGKGVRGRNMGGNSTGRGGKPNEGNKGARGGRGRGGKGSRGRGGPPVASVQPHLLRRNQKDKTDEMQEAMQHPAVDVEETVQCPLCTAFFSKDQIEDHAATCDSQAASEAGTELSCPRCSTYVPASDMEMHSAKCEKKHPTARIVGQPSTSGQRRDSTDMAPSQSQIMQDWSDDETDETVIQRPSKRRRTNNSVEDES